MLCLGKQTNIVIVSSVLASDRHGITFYCDGITKNVTESPNELLKLQCLESLKHLLFRKNISRFVSCPNLYFYSLFKICFTVLKYQNLTEGNK